MNVYLLIFAALLCSVHGGHFIVGNIANGELVHSDNVQYNAFPFVKRVKMYFYTQPENRKIVAIQALDNLHGQSSINITSGGVGYSYVNLRLKSERGVGLDYNVGIYAESFKY